MLFVVFVFVCSIFDSLPVGAVLTAQHQHKHESAASASNAEQNNVVVITDAEPDDCLALAILAVRAPNRVRMIGTTVLNAKRKAALVKHLLAQTPLHSVPIFVGTGGQPDDYPSVSHNRAAIEFESRDFEGQGILPAKELDKLSSDYHHHQKAAFSSKKAGHVDNEFRVEMQRLLEHSLNTGKQIEFIVLGPITDLVQVLELKPALKAAISHIHVMGGWEKRKDDNFWTTYNWSMDPYACSMLLKWQTEISMTLYSVHVYVRTLAGGSINSKLFPDVINAIANSHSPALEQFRKAAHAWDTNLLKTLPHYVEKIGGSQNIGRQFCPADPLTVIGFLNPGVATSTTPMRVHVDVNEMKPEYGFRVHATEDAHSKLRLVSGIDVKSFQHELMQSIEAIDKSSSVSSKKPTTSN